MVVDFIAGSAAVSALPWLGAVQVLQQLQERAKVSYESWRKVVVIIKQLVIVVEFFLRLELYTKLAGGYQIYYFFK